MKRIIQVTALAATFTLGLAAPRFAVAQGVDEDRKNDESIQQPVEEAQPPAQDLDKDKGLDSKAQEAEPESNLGSPKTLGLNEVPAAVKSTLEQEMKGGQLGQIVVKQKGDTTLYKAEIIKDGRTHHLLLASDGSVVKRKGPTEELPQKENLK